jgi:predicted protein tyrosine phosphatase
MSFIHVCSLARIESAVEETGARWMVTLLQAGTAMIRPAAIALDRHLFLSVSDIVEPVEGHILPGEEHVLTLLEFIRSWDRAAPLLVHCFAGVSRSTAAAFIAACALDPERKESDIARAIRAASPTATPNARFVALADKVLGRRGRMNEAIAAIGRGEACMEGIPFSLPIAQGLGCESA